ncbi:MAG: hypothetical protein JSR61_22265 [Proteobacteria bacterium]|nr:hypothetical protein [Pseudomonadota bacterium]
MTDALAERELLRWMRPDAHRFLRPDWRRHVREDSELAPVLALYEQKYRPDQPRVPAGSREGGQWSAEGGGSTPRSAANKPPTASPGITDRRVVSDAQPTYYKPGAKIAARISQSRQEECEIMHRQDLFICQAVQMATCYGQANLRYSNCLQGRQIPPLNF